jgi:hypothetical protein
VYRKLMTLIVVLAAAVATVSGAGATTAGTAATPRLKGAYLYRDHLAGSNQNFVRVVFRTASPLPRRFDGMIRAAAFIDGVGHSIGTIKRGTTCYTAASEIKGGSIAARGPGGSMIRKGAKLGRSFSFKLTTKGGGSVPRRAQGL